MADVTAKFLRGHALFHFVFTDQPDKATAILARLAATHGFSWSVEFIRGRGYPADTLYRYRLMSDEDGGWVSHRASIDRDSDKPLNTGEAEAHCGPLVPLPHFQVVVRGTLLGPVG